MAEGGLLDGGFMSGLESLSPSISSSAGGNDKVTSNITNKGDFIVGGSNSRTVVYLGLFALIAYFLYLKKGSKK